MPVILPDVDKDTLAHLEADQVELASGHSILVVQDSDKVALRKRALLLEVEVVAASVKLIATNQLAAIEGAGHGEVDERAVIAQVEEQVAQIGHTHQTTRLFGSPNRTLLVCCMIRI